MKHRVLVIEDEPAITDNIRYALETEGFETVCTPTGMPALSILDTQEVALIILDIGLPDINGLELCRAIRRSHHTPIIFLTARAEEIDRVVGLEIGGDDYVVKPFSPRELAARVRAILRRTAPPREEGGEVKRAENAGPFQVDPDRRAIRYHGRVLSLSRYEFDLLAALIRRPGRVFTRERLMDLVWDAPESSMDRTVDAHIKNIRKKLRAVRPDADPIRTHRGIGYSLAEDP